MAIIALAHLKGGVGKSTLAVNIAAVLAPKFVRMGADHLALRSASLIMVRDTMMARMALVVAKSGLRGGEG